MKTKQDIQTSVNQLLKDWMPFKSKPVHVIIVKAANPRNVATVSSHVIREGLSYRQDYNEVDLNVHESFFSYPEEAQERIIAHETYHVIQRNIYPAIILKDRKSIVPASGHGVTEYAPNIIELEAEVFCINVCGSSNYSLPGAKNQPLYRKILNQILSLQENPEEFPEISL